MRYCPVPALTTLRVFSMRTGLAASTVTPGNTAADASRTTPAIVAWANTTLGSSRISASPAVTLATRCITTLLDPLATATVAVCEWSLDTDGPQPNRRRCRGGYHTFSRHPTDLKTRLYARMKTARPFALP